jgi:hypothetical protein
MDKAIINSLRCILCFCLMCTDCYAQNWQTVATLFGVYQIVANPENELLYMRNYSLLISDSVVTQGLSKWNGSQLSTINNQTIPPWPNFPPPQFSDSRLNFFGGNLYYSGSNGYNPMSFETDPISPILPGGHKYLIQYNGVNWENVPISSNGRIGILEVIEGKLWGIEGRTTIGQPFKFFVIDEEGEISENVIEASGIPYLMNHHGHYTSLVKFYDFYYLGRIGAGSFSGTSLIKWDGSESFEMIAPWPSTSIEALAVYQDKLIVGGTFTTSNGAPNNNIAVWNGLSWETMNGISTDGTVNQFYIHNGILYFSGDFTLIQTENESIPANKIGWFNGVEFGSLSSDVINGSINSICFFQDTLFIGGYFNTINFDPHNGFAKFTGQLPSPVTSINSTSDSAEQINAFPNPFSAQLTIEHSFVKNGNLEVYDSSGKLMFTRKVVNQNFSIIDAANFGPQGIYFIKCIPANGNPTIVKVNFLP